MYAIELAIICGTFICVKGMRFYFKRKHDKHKWDDISPNYGEGIGYEDFVEIKGEDILPFEGQIHLN